MSCLNPTQAWQDLGSTTKNGCHPVIFSHNQLDPTWYDYVLDNASGEVVFYSTRYKPLNLPCGKCILCRKARSWEITVRALLEWQADPFQPCCFITLTVDDEHMQEIFPAMVLRHRPWQLFAKRLRKKVGSFRYLMCGEYGEKSRRPHYHAIIYGRDLTDRKFDFESCTYCDSPLLRDVWQAGQVMCRPVNANAIAYVAGYQLKLDKGEFDIDDLFSADLGEDDDKLHLSNYCKWSRQPGLGLPFLLKYADLFRQREYKLDDGKTVPVISPSIIRSGKESHFDGRYFKKFMERCSKDEALYDRWLSKPETKKYLATLLHLGDKFDKMSVFRESRVLEECLHSLSCADYVRARNLKNRAELNELQLARKARDLVA